LRWEDKANLNDRTTRFQVVDTTHLATFFGLSQPGMIMFSSVQGNDFTKHFLDANRSSKVR
jgi:hypothetical protein